MTFTVNGTKALDLARTYRNILQHYYLAAHNDEWPLPKNYLAIVRGEETEPIYPPKVGSQSQPPMQLQKRQRKYWKWKALATKRFNSARVTLRRGTKTPWLEFGKKLYPRKTIIAISTFAALSHLFLFIVTPKSVNEAICFMNIRLFYSIICICVASLTRKLLSKLKKYKYRPSAPVYSE
jgi:hypothetical protein